MTRRNASMLITVAALVLTVPPLAGAQAASRPAVDITLASRPTPPTPGSNTFEVRLKDAAGKPVADAEVSLLFYMAAMPAMKMPEMKNTIPLKHVKEGLYSGMGSVMMAGSWEVTVSVRRGGKEMASKQLPLVAK